MKYILKPIFEVITGEYILFDNNTKIDLISKKYMKDLTC